MPVTYDRTYRPVCINIDADLPGCLDEYQSRSMSGTKHMHAALELYLEHLHKTEAKKSVWMTSSH